MTKSTKYTVKQITYESQNALKTQSTTTTNELRTNTTLHPSYQYLDKALRHLIYCGQQYNTLIPLCGRAPSWHTTIPGTLRIFELHRLYYHHWPIQPDICSAFSISEALGLRSLIKYQDHNVWRHRPSSQNAGRLNKNYTTSLVAHPYHTTKLIKHIQIGVNLYTTPTQNCLS